MGDRTTYGLDQPALLHLEGAHLDSPVPPVGRLDASVQEDIDAILRFLRHTGYPAVAAPQLGLRRRVLAVDLSRTGRSPIVLVDPALRAVSRERTTDLEGCLSLPGLVARVRRPQRIRIAGRARTGQRVVLDAAGLLARILQHKLEHLDGRLFLDRVSSPDRLAVLDEASDRRPTCHLSPLRGRRDEVA